MLANDKRLSHIAVAGAFLLVAVLACTPTCGQPVSVVINSPPDGSTAVVGQEVLIDSTASASAGVERVELVVNSALIRRDSPPAGNPATFRISQGWTPDAEGYVVVSVVAYDVNGNSSPQATLTLQVVAGGAVAPTTEPGATAAPEPTVTPEPDVTTESGCTLNASYVADVTVPDDTELAPGSSVGKTWRIRNSGTCDWTAGFNLVFLSGDQMGGEASVPVPATAAGSTVDMTVHITAETTPGTYKGNWRMQSDEGLAFGSTFYVRIIVPSPATDTPLPTDVPTGTPEPTATPYGGGSQQIVYVSFRDGNAELYVIGEDDASPTRLTNHPEIDSWPDWSPDGSKIAFSRYFGGKPDIYVMKADGSLQTNLTNHPEWDSGPSWAPDGSRIAFASDRAGGTLQIWVMKADGSDPTQLTDTPKLNVSPDWSPDGNRIAFESMRDNQREIYVMNSDGAGPTRLTFSDNNYGPKWSPNGNWIVFSSSDGIWKVKPNGASLTQLTTNADPLTFDVHPQWSPDGRNVIFDSKRDGNSDLWVVRANGSGLRKYTTNAAEDMNPDWR
jgi:TolB protein